MTDRFWVGGSGNWDATDTTHWSATSGGAGGASAPTSSDNVFLDSAVGGLSGGTATHLSGAVCKNLTISSGFAGGTNKLAGTATLTISGSLLLNSGNLSLDGASVFLFNSTSTGNTITINNELVNSKSFTFDGVGGEWIFTDANPNFGVNCIFTLTNGHLNFNNKNVTMRALLTSNSNIRTISLGSGTTTFNESGSSIGTVFDATNSTNLTVTATSGVIRFSNTAAASKTFAGGGKTYGTLSLASGAGPIYLTGGNTLTAISVTGGLDQEVVFPGSETTTLTGATPLPSGISGSPLVLRASSGSATLAFSSQVSIDYVSLTNIAASGVTPARAGTHSMNGGGNTNWLFNSPMTSLFFPLLLA